MGKKIYRRGSNGELSSHWRAGARPVERIRDQSEKKTVGRIRDQSEKKLFPGLLDGIHKN